MSTRARTAERRRRLSTRALIFGPLFCLGGWVASFTLVGAGLIVLGSLIMAAGFALDPRVRTALLASLGLVVCWGWILVYFAIASLF